jgi:hypothetical protein
MPADPGGTYRISTLGPIVQLLRDWAERAVKLGLREKFATNLRTVQQKLATEPLVWGEDRYTLPGRKARVRQGAAAWLHVTYSVDEQARVVFVTKVRLMPNTPLADAP